MSLVFVLNGYAISVLLVSFSIEHILLLVYRRWGNWINTILKRMRQNKKKINVHQNENKNKINNNSLRIVNKQCTNGILPLNWNDCWYEFCVWLTVESVLSIKISYGCARAHIHTLTHLHCHHLPCTFDNFSFRQSQNPIQHVRIHCECVWNAYFSLFVCVVV